MDAATPPVWPPTLLLLQGLLLTNADTAELHRILYNAPLRPSNDEQLAAVRVLQGSNIQTWLPADQAGWITRRPIGEWLFYVRDGSLEGLLQPSYLWAL